MTTRTTFLDFPCENPFILASAPPTANADMIRRAFDAGWAGAVVKTLIREPVLNIGNRFASWRTNGKVAGFENLELLSELPPEEWFRIIADITEEYPGKLLIASIMGDAHDAVDWLYLARGSQDAGADMLELNFSCPHGYPERGKGSAIGQSAEYSAAITRWLAESPDVSLPIIPKLTAAVGDIRFIGESIAGAGADGLVAVNTLPSLFGIDLKTLRPKPDVHGRTAYGGYSGPGIKPIALRAVATLCRSPGLPLMASGGISSGFDAAEFMLLGAHAVQVCTAVMLNGYDIVSGMIDDLSEFMAWHEFESPRDFIGTCNDMVVSYGDLERDPDYQPAVDKDLCVRCGACITACRDGGYGAIDWDNSEPRWNMDRCVGCSLCSHVCPTHAIAMVEAV